MKNIYLLPTEKPSRLSDCHDNKLYLDDVRYLRNYKNIYITSDVTDINENDYIITQDGRLVQVSYLLSKDLEGASKVILTTDQDLIKDGVQAIDDDFLEWFVPKANDSGKPIDIVEVDYRYDANLQPILDSFGNKVLRIKIPTESENLSQIIIPKQETLEEEAKKYFKKVSPNVCFYDAVKFGAKWQQEKDNKEIEDLKNRLDVIREINDKAIKMIEELEVTQRYSELDIVIILEKFRNLPLIQFQEWFEQFKK